VTGNQVSWEGLQISLENHPSPTLAHTPMASLEEMIILLISPESSARAPTLATPMLKLA
jgi:hypothetical protein